MNTNRYAARKPVFYGWMIVLASTAVMATAVGIVNNCFGLLIIPACEEMGCTRAQMAGNQTMLSLGAMIMSVVTGRVIDKKNLRWLMRGGAVVMCTLYAGFAVLRSLPLMYGVALCVGLAQGFINLVPLSILIRNWFVKRRGLALGITCMGSGLGGMVFNLLGGVLVERIGWRRTVLAFDAILCAVVLPLVFFAIHVDPAEKGLHPLGGQGPVEERLPSRSASTRRAPTNLLLLLIVGVDITIAGMGVNGIGATMTPYYTDVFRSQSIGAKLTSGYMASLAIGKLALGWLYDRVGTLRATVAARLLLMGALLALFLGDTPIFVALFLLLSGVGAATSSVSVPFLAEKLADEGKKDSLTGIYTGLQFLGSLLAPLFCGWICGFTGSYAPAYRTLIIGIAVTLPWLSLSLKSGETAR